MPREGLHLVDLGLLAYGLSSGALLHHPSGPWEEDKGELLAGMVPLSRVSLSPQDVPSTSLTQ